MEGTNLKRSRRVISFVLGITLLMTACFVSLGASGVAGEGLRIYAVPATVKYRIDEEITSYYQDGVAHIQAAVNEYEAVQVIMQADSNVGYFDAFSSDLVSTANADSRITAENIEIFYEHYKCGAKRGKQDRGGQ